MAESKVFKLLNGVNAEMIASALEGYLRDEYQMNVQSGKTTGGYVVQGRQESDGWKKLSGTDLAISVQLFETSEILNVTIGYSKWSDKIGAGIVGAAFFAPLMFTAAVGATRQKQLPRYLFDFIEKFILSGGQSANITLRAGRFLNHDEILCPNCNEPNLRSDNFCSKCGAQLSIKCPKCGADVKGAFCANCGTKYFEAVNDISVPDKKCPQCHFDISEADKFCSTCGAVLTDND